MADEKPIETQPKVDDAARMKEFEDRLVAGLSAALPKAVERLSDQNRPAPVVTAPAAVATLVAPAEEEIIAAIENGNKAEAARLMRLRDAAKEQAFDRKLGALSSQGGAAIGALARKAAEDLPHFKQFKKEISEKMDAFQAANPGVVPTYDHWKSARDIVVGEHMDEVLAADREETLRKAREPDPDLTPDNARLTGGGKQEEEPKSLAELLPGDWKNEFKPKSRAVGGRTDDEELRRMGFRGGFAEFAKARKEMNEIEEETGGSMGMDREWDAKTGKWMEYDKRGHIIRP